ncbi:type II toxin-antitoxin system Phd/YefM family antitoxin [Zavarzinia aquatilis]|uniref:Type II toxin-antitoxin system Phd/YefM family antitoxin n=1 Tax=Zavarzinia aquatilis TaxID=2211142 RepID=A0A317EDG2_9PROT|nr:type II toxin-antitoxin system Phd/YefM family antitoxin [Zavarzinia aquatilis]PWR24306.1 type II toxin-antitoxin system Phd/YefM family antitoxin [Zavarzinia aquatilis]
MKISSTEFQQNVGRYQDMAQREPVSITRNGRAHTVLISAALFETALKGRVARKIEDLDKATIMTIADSGVSSEFASLDEFIEDWKP